MIFFIDVCFMKNFLNCTRNMDEIDLHPTGLELSLLGLHGLIELFDHELFLSSLVLHLFFCLTYSCLEVVSFLVDFVLIFN